MILHPSRYSISGVVLRKLGVVVHTAESPDDRTNALISYMTKPGDRPVDPKDPDSRLIGSGYHAVTAGDGTYIRTADWTAGPFAAPPLNKTWAHICMPGYARQTRDEWLDPLSRSHIKGVALFIRDVCREFNLPVQHINSRGLLAGESGYTSHAEVSKAWGATDHTDPGSSFPWDVLANDIFNITPRPAPPTVTPPEDDMQITIFTVRDSRAVFLGETTPRGIALNVRWSGPGSPKVLAMLEAHRRAGAIDRTIDVADLSNAFLLGPLPVDDVRTWTPDDFAGL